jgi:hypothetical protein
MFYKFFGGRGDFFSWKFIKFAGNIAPSRTFGVTLPLCDAMNRSIVTTDRLKKFFSTAENLAKACHFLSSQLRRTGMECGNTFEHLLRNSKISSFPMKFSFHAR